MLESRRKFANKEKILSNFSILGKFSQSSMLCAFPKGEKIFFILILSGSSRSFLLFFFSLSPFLSFSLSLRHAHILFLVLSISVSVLASFSVPWCILKKRGLTPPPQPPSHPLSLSLSLNVHPWEQSPYFLVYLWEQFTGNSPIFMDQSNGHFFTKILFFSFRARGTDYVESGRYWGGGVLRPPHNPYWKWYQTIPI